MSNAWDHAASMADKHANSGGIFIRLTSNGDKVIGAFCGEPFPREVVWTGERYETYDPEVHTDKRPSLRVMLNFYVPAEGAMKVIEGGTVWFKDVLKVRDKYGLDKWLFEIERHGEAGDPKTTYTILPEEKLTAAQKEEIDSLGLHDLAALVAGDGGDDDPPIDAETAAELVARLKALPRADVDTFLEQFGVQRVRELKASHEAAARELLGGLEARARRKAAPREEVDPFA
ncbi:MAG TPA: hypothetical protein ENK20_09700 [Chromatiales bacterium]|nr:hypothetical protein [Chromatiales bacterium]